MNKFDTKQCLEDLSKFYKVSISFVTDKYIVTVEDITGEYAAKDDDLDHALWKIAKYVLPTNTLVERTPKDLSDQGPAKAEIQEFLNYSYEGVEVIMAQIDGEERGMLITGGVIRLHCMHPLRLLPHLDPSFPVSPPE